MNIKMENTCRLCLNNITNSIVEVIGKFTIEALDLIFQNLNLNVSEKPVMCNTCSDHLKKSFDFKSMCLGVEDSIKRFADRKGEITLSEVYKEIRENVDTTDLEDKEICRFCLNVVANNFKSLKEDAIADMTLEYIPELNLNISPDPVLCLPCSDAFRSYVTFVTSCSNVEEEITRYLHTVGSDSNGYIELAEVTRFAQKNLDSVTNSSPTTVKLETASMEKIKCEKYDEDCFTPVDFVKTKVCKEDVDEDTCMESLGYTKCEDESGKECKSTELLLDDVKTEDCDTSEGGDDEGYIRYDDRLDLSVEKAKAELKRDAQDPNSFQPSLPAKHEHPLELHSFGYDPPLYHLNAYAASPGGQDEVSDQSQKLTSTPTPHIPTDEKYKCDTCGYRTKYEAYLTRHLQKHKDKPAPLKPGSKIRSAKRTQRPDDQILKCDLCDYETAHKYRLRQHGLTHMDPSEVPLHECEQCGFKTKWRNTLRKHSLRHKDSSEVTMYSCEFCEYTTKCRSYLFQHSLVHREAPVHKCGSCSYETKYKSYLTRHLLMHKNPSDIYKCPDCQFKTYSEVSMSKHATKHGDASKSPRFKCEVCGYHANRQSRLKAHMLTHQDPADVHIYECDQCKFQTKWRCTFNKHRLAHDTPSQALTYSCDLCEYKTRSRVYLNKHSMVHKDSSEIEMQRCKLCGFRTKTTQYLRSHMLTHVDMAKLDEAGGVVNGEKIQVYECDVCQYKAKRKGQLVQHMSKHTAGEVKMYRCETCGFETKWTQSLKAHKRSMHK
ncbi:zinc finger protein 729-like [Anoplophora glabripennis]|uniref:zinc finger protein 729-like n=1 Tax=Anoplophora glabripennis TaxID=217634 RepID=UPI0008753928|nr:zinc finger protein 729-like [Anoplophora glabripennis]